MVINTNNLLGPLGCLALLVIEGTLGPSDSWYLMFSFLPIPGHLGLQDRLVDLGRSSWLLTSLVQLLFTHNINRWSSLHIVLSQRNPHRHWNNLPEKSCNSGGALWRFGTCLTQGKARTYMPINSQFPRATEQPLRRPVAACLLVWFVRAWCRTQIYMLGQVLHLLFSTRGL